MMKKTVFVFCAISLVLSGAAVSMAQTPTAEPMGPPKVLAIFREEVKYGKGAAHEKFEGGFVQASKRANWPTHYLAMTSMSGPSEAWYITPFDSFEAWEKDQQATEKAKAFAAELSQLSEKDAEYVSGARSIVAIYREDLSYRVGVKIPEMRYFSVTTVRVRPGHDEDFVEARKTINAAHEKANVDEHWAVFQVTSGMPGGTYLIFAPLKSLKQVDAIPTLHGQTYRDALGDEGRKKLRELSSAGTLSSETNLFAFSPKMSYPSKEFAAGDPDFWTPKAKAAAKAAPAKKEEAMPAAPAKKAPAKPAKKQ